MACCSYDRTARPEWCDVGRRGYYRHAGLVVMWCAGELLGRVTVLLDEVRRMQAGRQILPLVGRPHSRTATSGSITVEVLTASVTLAVAAVSRWGRGGAQTPRQIVARPPKYSRPPNCS